MPPLSDRDWLERHLRVQGRPCWIGESALKGEGAAAAPALLRARTGGSGLQAAVQAQLLDDQDQLRVTLLQLDALGLFTWGPVAAGVKAQRWALAPLAALLAVPPLVGVELGLGYLGVAGALLASTALGVRWITRTEPGRMLMVRRWRRLGPVASELLVLPMSHGGASWHIVGLAVQRELGFPADRALSSQARRCLSGELPPSPELVPELEVFAALRLRAVVRALHVHRAAALQGPLVRWTREASRSVEASLLELEFGDSALGLAVYRHVVMHALPRLDDPAVQHLPPTDLEALGTAQLPAELAGLLVRTESSGAPARSGAEE